MAWLIFSTYFVRFELKSLSKQCWLNVIMQAASRNHGDGIDCNYYSTTQHQHESPHRDVIDNTAYAELGDGKVMYI